MPYWRRTPRSHLRSPPGRHSETDLHLSKKAARDYPPFSSSPHALLAGLLSLRFLLFFLPGAIHSHSCSFFLDFPFSSCSLITRRSLSSLTVFLFRKTFTSSAGTTVAHLSHVCQFRLHGVQACKRHPVVTISPVSRCLMMMCHLDLDSVSATHLVRLQGHSVGRLTLSLCWTALYLPSTTLI